MKIVTFAGTIYLEESTPQVLYYCGEGTLGGKSGGVRGEVGRSRDQERR